MAGDNDIELRVGIEADDSSIEEYSRKLTNALNNAVKQVQSKAIYANTETLNDYVNKARQLNTSIGSFYKKISAESGNSIDYPKNFDTGALKTYLDTYKEVLKVQKLVLDGQSRLNSREAFSTQESRFNDEIRRTKSYTEKDALLNRIYRKENPYEAMSGTAERYVPYGSHITNENMRRDLYNYIDEYGTNAYKHGPASYTWKNQPLTAHGEGGMLRHESLLMSGIESDSAVMGLSEKDRNSLLFSAGMSNIFAGTKNSDAELGYFMKNIGYSNEYDILYNSKNRLNKTYSDVNYLVSQPYAEDYIRKNNNGKTTVDMFGLREEAVKRGEGKWVDAKAGNTPENFERVTKDVTKNSKDTDDSLKSTLVTLGEIYALYKLIAKVAKDIVKFDTKATNTTESVASQLNSGGRWYLGINTMQELGTFQAENTAGLGRGTVLGEMNKLGSNLGEMSTTGKGIDFLGTSLLGNLGVILNSNSGYDAYIKSLDFLREQYKNLPKDSTGSKKREAIGNYIEKELGKTAYDLFNYGMLHLGKDQTFASLFALPNNPYFSAYGDVEEQSAKLKKVQSSIDADWQKIYNDWNTHFGIPFKEYWDSLLQKFIGSPIYKLIFGDEDKNQLSRLEKRDLVHGAKDYINNEYVDFTNGFNYADMLKHSSDVKPYKAIKFVKTENGSLISDGVYKTGFVDNPLLLNDVVKDLKIVASNPYLVDSYGKNVGYMNSNAVKSASDVYNILKDSGYLKYIENGDKLFKNDSETYNNFEYILNSFIQRMLEKSLDPNSVKESMEDIIKSMKSFIDPILKGEGKDWDKLVGKAPININISGVDTSSAYDVGMAVRNALMDSSIAVSAMG